MEEFWLCFVPFFIAMDPIGVLPLFVSMTEGMEKDRLKTVIWQSILTAATVALAFLIFGPVVLKFLGITIPDFMIAGGLLLLAISLNSLLTGEKKQRHGNHEILGAVSLAGGEKKELSKLPLRQPLVSQFKGRVTFLPRPIPCRRIRSLYR